MYCLSVLYLPPKIFAGILQIKRGTMIAKKKTRQVLTRVLKAISICTEGSKSQCNVLLIAGKACNKLPA
jgi:hypothetical protein